MIGATASRGMIGLGTTILAAVVTIAGGASARGATGDDLIATSTTGTTMIDRPSRAINARAACAAGVGSTPLSARPKTMSSSRSMPPPISSATAGEAMLAAVRKNSPDPIATRQAKGISSSQRSAKRGYSAATAGVAPASSCSSISRARADSFSVSLLSWPQAARMSRPRGVRTGEA